MLNKDRELLKKLIGNDKLPIAGSIKTTAKSHCREAMAYCDLRLRDSAYLSNLSNFSNLSNPSNLSNLSKRSNLSKPLNRSKRSKRSNLSNLASKNGRSNLLSKNPKSLSLKKPSPSDANAGVTLNKRAAATKTPVTFALLKYFLI